MDLNNYTIFGFISYSRKDKKIANWLHDKLEKYAYPVDLVDEHQRPPHGKYLRPIFLDTQDLQVEERPFTDKLKDCLRRAKFLLVICSKSSAKSPFVNMEINYFLETHNRNYALIVPLFVDEVEDCIPSAFNNTTIMERHFPIYNTLLGGKSEANEYCFIQLAAYLLGVDFSSIFNRYEESIKRERRKQIRKLIYLICVLVLTIVSLGYNVYSQRRIIEKERKIIIEKQKLIMFEQDIFPRAVVFGYEENFLRPTIKYLKEQNKPFKINVVLPKTERELRNHQDRVLDVSLLLKQKLQIDSIVQVTLPTSMKRGSRIMTIRKQNAPFDGMYLDFATTTSSFIKVAEYKKGHEEYKELSLNEIIEGYSVSFIRQTKELLERDSIYVDFYLSVDELVQTLEL